MFQQLENENLCQNPPNKPIDIAPMIWYDKCMLIPYKDSSDKFVTKKNDMVNIVSTIICAIKLIPHPLPCKFRHQHAVVSAEHGFKLF